MGLSSYRLYTAIFVSLISFHAPSFDGSSFEGSVCNQFEALPLSELPPLFGPNTTATNLQATYAAYVDHLKSNMAQEDFSSQYFVTLVDQFLRDDEFIEKVRMNLPLSLEATSLRARLRQIFYSNRKVDWVDMAFLVTLLDLIQSSESLLDLIKLEAQGKQFRFTEDHKMQLAIFLGGKEPEATGEVRKQHWEAMLHLNPQKIIDPSYQGQSFSDDAHLRAFTGALWSQLLLHPPLLISMEFGGQKLLSFDTSPLILVPSLRQLTAEDRANLSVWPIFAISMERREDATIYSVPSANHGEHRSWNITSQSGVTMLNKGQTMGALESNWNFFSDVIVPRQRREHEIEMRGNPPRELDPARLERAVRDRYLCSCRVLGVEGVQTPEVKSALADIWGEMATKGDHLTPLNSPERMAVYLSKPSSKETPARTMARAYLLERVIGLDDSCRALERQDDKSSNQSAARIARAALERIEIPQMASSFPELAGADAKIKEAKAKGVKSPPVEWAPWIHIPKAPNAANDNVKKNEDRDDEDLPANDNDPGEGDLAIAARVIQDISPSIPEGVLLEVITTVLERMTTKEAVQGVAIGAAAVTLASHQSVLKAASRIARGISFRYPTPARMGARAAQGLLIWLGVTTVIAEATAAAEAEELLNRARTEDGLEYQLTLPAIREAARAKVIEERASHPLLAIFYHDLAEEILNVWGT